MSETVLKWLFVAERNQEESGGRQAPEIKEKGDKGFHSQLPWRSLAVAPPSLPNEPLDPRKILTLKVPRPQNPGPLTNPAFRANPFPKVTDLFCRLPLPTLFYPTRGWSPWRPDAVISTTSEKNKRGRTLLRENEEKHDQQTLPRIFKGRSERTWQTNTSVSAIPSTKQPVLQIIWFRGCEWAEVY